MIKNKMFFLTQYIAATVIICIFVQLSSGDENIDLFKKIAEIREEEHLVKFLDSLDTSELLTLGHQYGVWVQQNPNVIIDMGHHQLMLTIMEKYVHLSNGKPDRNKIQSIIISKDEPWFWRTMWIVWLRENIHEKPGLYVYFSDDLPSFFNIFSSITTDKKEDAHVRKKVINESVRLLSYGIKSYKNEIKSTSIGEFINLQTKNEILILIELINDPKENVDVIKESLKGLKRLFPYVEPSYAENIKACIKHAFDKREQYPHEVQIAFADWIISLIGKESIKQEVDLLEKEYPSFEEEIKRLRRKMGTENIGNFF